MPAPVVLRFGGGWRAPSTGRGWTGEKSPVQSGAIGQSVKLDRLQAMARPSDGADKAVGVRQPPVTPNGSQARHEAPSKFSTLLPDLSLDLAVSHNIAGP